jgi:hypothetical protein
MAPPYQTKEAGIMEQKENTFKEPPRIGNRSDALALLDSMIARIGRTNAGAPPRWRGKENAIGSAGYYWPRLEALRDAIGRGII